jgi:hypothetical protein
VDSERQRIVCRVEAEDLPAARTAARCLGGGSHTTWLSALPPDDTTTVGGGAEPNRATGSGTLTKCEAGTDTGAHAGVVAARGARPMIDVLAEWRPDPPIDVSRFVLEQMACDRCLDAWRVQPGPVATSDDGRRVVAFLRAPDAEAVRNAYRHATVPFDRVIALRRLDR